MINLKHLYLVPFGDRSPPNNKWVSSNCTLFESFNFQLATLTWTSYYHRNNRFLEFFKMQHSIIHLDVGRSRNGLTWLDEGICPQLVSVSGGFNSLSHVARSRKIIAWRWYPGLKEAPLVAQDSSPLDSLKYLSVFDYALFRKTIGPIDLNIILLELTEGSWKFDVSSRVVKS